MRLQVIKHVPFEGPGAIATWAQARGHSLALTELAAGQALPALDAFDALVLMGGPMSVNDEADLAWLAPEKALLRATLASGKKVLGVCLGAQMIASALGAPISRNPDKEIGWFPVEATPQGRRHPFWAGLPDAFPCFHWHGETFALPPGATALLRSAACEAQGFALGVQALALQCHVEVDASSLDAMIVNGRAELDLARPFIQPEAVLRGQPQALARLWPHLERLLDNWVMA
jgi:GMP synthase-like glutamine amidotransferase